MKEPVLDGELHILDNQTACIGQEITDPLYIVEGGLLDQIITDYMQKIAGYIYDVSREKAIALIIKAIYRNHHFRGFVFDEMDLQMIYKHATELDLINPKPTIAMKFSRLPNDEDFFKDELDYRVVKS